ncbi:MAG: trans-aconitate 2-methyltransferase [Alphaproteobacteria bacterium]|nr:trans-aconitate 2-methyltransferase [Alphaproteobacteria bacterium]
MAWDPGAYLSFGSERTRPALELLDRVLVDKPSIVVDLGCGPGNSTALLAARWRDAWIEGVDSSPEMLSEARLTVPGVQWTEADIAQWRPRESPHVIFSNAVLQWVADHADLLPRLMSYVARGGALAFQVPCNFGEPSHVIVRDIARHGPWAGALDAVREKGDVLAAADYYDILEPQASHLDIWETTYLQVLDGEDAVFRWVSGTSLRPLLQALDGTQREAFRDECKRRLATAYRQRPSGRTLFPFRRLFVVARR